MIKRIARYFVPVLTAGILVISGCGTKASETMADKTVTLEGGVYSLELYNPGGVAVSFKKLDAQVNCGGGSSTCRLTANENVIDSISIDVDETKKTIRLSGNCTAFDMSVSFLVNADVKDIYASGAYDIVYNAGTELTDISVGLSGACDIEITGECQNASFSASGGSDIEAFGLKANNVKVSVSGGSDAMVYASEKLEADASGGSDVVYDGNPENVEKNASGGSEIKAR